jgi:hypothetical protein
MDKNEFETFDNHAPSVERHIAAEDLKPTSRTLTHGYTCDRHSFHVFLYDGEIHVRVYDFNGSVINEDSGASMPAEILRPDKRVYPQYTDIEFAEKMRAAGYPLPFTTWSEPRRSGPFYGDTFFSTAR